MLDPDAGAAGLSDEQVEEITASDAFGPLASELRRAEANDHDIATVLPNVVAQRSFDDANDIGAVLISRLRHATSGSKRTKPPGSRLIAGLVPVADGPMTDDMRRALVEREGLMEARTAALAEAAVARRATWVKRLGEPPMDPGERRRWMEQVRTVVAYRDRYGVEVPVPVGVDVRSDVQGLDAARARQAVRHAASISTDATIGVPPILDGQVLG